MPWLVLRLLALKSWLSSRTKRLTTKPVRVGIFVFVVSFLFRAIPAQAAPFNVDTLLQSFAEFAYSLASTITKLIVLLIDVMVPIMTYNNFVGNPVVKAGWAIVRDTVNMFFVVILIIIAFGTIFGAEKFKWQQQVPRLLIMAVVINFSKTLCGIMIDFGQVIMLTFANALREIAAGNFIQLLGLNEIYQVSQVSDMITSIKEDGGQGASNAFDFFASGVASVLLTLWVLAVLVIMVAILLFRIVMLWVLVVMAPLAWFMKGASGIIDSNAYKDWWNEFKCLVGIGPVLAFFLWLTLAVAGAGNIAANSGFNVSADSNNAGFTSSLLEVNNFLSFLIGMAMLSAGLKAASQFCSAAVSGAFIGKRLATAQAFSPEKVLKTLARTTGTGVGLGIKAGSVGVRGGARALAATPDLVKSVARNLPISGLSTLTRDIGSSAKKGAWGAVGAAGGSTFIGKWGRGKKADVALKQRAMQFEDVNKEKDAMKDKDRDWKKTRILDNQKNPPTSDRGRAQDIALFEEMMGDKRLQKELGRDKVQELWKSHGSKYEDMAKGNVAKTEDLKGFKKKYAHITGSVDKIKDVDDVRGLSADAWTDEAVREKAIGIKTSFEKGKDKDGKKTYMNAFEAAQAGLIGNTDVLQAVTAAGKIDTSSQVEKTFTEALGRGDKKAADSAVTQIETKYNNSGTSEEDRQKMARSMDRMRAAAAQMGKGGGSKATTANDVLANLNTKRKGMEAVMGFGIPAPKAGESADEYVDKNFSQSSGERIDEAVSQMDRSKVSVERQQGEIEKKLADLKGVEKTISDKQKQIAEVRKRIEDSVKQDSKQAYQPVRRGRKNLAVAEAKGDAGEIEQAQNALREAEAKYTNVEIEGNNEMKNSPDITSLEAELQETIDAAGGTARLEEVKEKSRRLRILQAQADRLIETKARLEQERTKRST